MHSVVILIYNQNEQMNCLLTSLERQTVKPDEVIIIDNNSTEKYQVYDNYSFPIIYNRLEYSDSPDRRAQARNIGYEIASGNIITFFDGDCLPLKPDYLEIVQKELTENMLLAGYRISVKMGMIEESGDILAQTFNSQPVTFETSWTTFESNNFSLFKKDFQLFDGNFRGWGYEDVEMAYRHWKNGYKLTLLNSLLVGHIDHLFTIDDTKRATIKKNALYFMKKYGKNDEVFEGLSKGMENFNIDPEELNTLWRSL